MTRLSQARTFHLPDSRTNTEVLFSHARIQRCTKLVVRSGVDSILHRRIDLPLQGSVNATMVSTPSSSTFFCFLIMHRWALVVAVAISYISMIFFSAMYAITGFGKL